MLFTSFAFIFLLIITFSLYYIARFEKFQIPILIISSLVFYTYNQPILVLLLLFSVSINIISSYYVVYGKKENQKLFAFSGVALNLLILIFFKYSALISMSFSIEDTTIGEFFINLPLPIGISFFTFQGISLIVDVFRNKYGNNKDFVPQSFLEHSKQILFFKGFFPQLISGPIVKAHDFIPQIQTKYLKDVQWEVVLKLIITGYFLKMVVADNLKDYTFYISYPYYKLESSITLITMLFGYSFQIFADFAGYSLIAIGLAKLFGYDFMQNFNFPYISNSFKDFWKRWHISLSSFLMEYLYIPLGGNRKGQVRTYINLMIVMILGGLWHGASWSYGVWGAMHGLALVVEKFLSDKFKWTTNIFLRISKTVFVFLFVSICWLLFKLPNFEHVLDYLSSIQNNFWSFDNPIKITPIIIYSSPVIIYHFLYLIKGKKTFEFIKKHDYLWYAVMLFLIIVNSGSAGAFIYFQF